MAIELSNIIFTDQDDIVPQSGVEEIVNTSIANTLAGNDLITGTGVNGFKNLDLAIFNTDDGNDIITGTGTITGVTIGSRSTLDTGKGNDVITGTTDRYYGVPNYGLLNGGTFNTDDGNDIITGTGGLDGLVMGYGAILDTGKGNDIITGIASYGIWNFGIINTDNGEDSIISQGTLINYGGLFLGDGNDSITANRSLSDTDLLNLDLENYNVIETGDGNDIISSNSVIYNLGVINTGNGEDSIIVDGSVYGAGREYGIKNNGGTINMGNGNDSIIANEGFQSAFNGSGSVFLGNGEDYIKGFGSGDFYGGHGNDILELTPGSYTVEIWDTSAIFTKNGVRLMITSEFEELIAGNTTYDFTSLTAGQIIIVS